MNPLSQAIEQHDIERAKNLIAQNTKRAAENNIDAGADSPLHLAAWQDLTEIVELLIQSGADMNARGNNGYTPLHYAAKEGCIGSARVLLAAGANPDLKDDAGWSPLLRAVRGREPFCLEVARLLMSYVSQPDLNSLVSLGAVETLCEQLERDGRTLGNAPEPEDLVEDFVVMLGEKITHEVGYEASLENQQAVVTKYQIGLFCLIDAGADVNAIGKSGQPPLFTAIQTGHLPIIKLLLDNVANPNFNFQDGNRSVNALSFTSGPQGKAIRHLLIEFGFQG